jgi:two-component system probable response regulator PhcQ
MTDHPPQYPLILFVDDEAASVKYFQRAIDSLATVVTAGTVEEGKQLLDKHAQTLMVLVSDQRMPGGYGNELLHYARTQHPHIVRILTTAYSELAHTVEAVNQGQIHRYIQKPWEISALRMELKQALELATLRKEHAELMREKMLVLQSQTISNRIGTLHTLCASLGDPDQLLPVADYLSAAALIGAQAPKPDWSLMDYSDLVSAEAYRNGQFGHAVNSKLAEIKQHLHSRPSEDGDEFTVLKAMLGDKVRISNEGTAEFLPAQILSEFLDAPLNTPVSPEHVTWLAFLIGLYGLGKSLRIAESASGIQFRIEKLAQPGAPVKLAEWIEQFCDRPQS